MAHHFLNGVEIRPVFQKVHRKAVPQGMGCDVLFNMGRFLIVLQNFPETLTAHTLPTHIYKQGRFSGAATMPGRTSRM